MRAHFGYHHPPRAAITPHNRLAYPPSTSWPSAITHPSIFEQQSQPFLKSINISIFHTHTCPIWSPPPTCIAQCLWAINPSSLPPFPGVLATTTTLWWPSLPILCRSLSTFPFTHGWGAIKYPDVPLFHTGPSPYLVPCQLCRHFCPPTAEEPLKYPFVRGPCYLHCMSAPFSTFPVNQYWQNRHLQLGSH